MAEKIAAAVAAKRDHDFLFIARTDSRAVEDFDGAVKRAQAYVAAGADAIFPEALQTKEEFRDFAKEVKVPLLANMTEFGKSPLLSFEELGELGYRMVIFPQSAFRVSMKATAEFLRDLKKSGNQRRLAGENADAGGALRVARLRSGAESRGLGIALMGVIPSEAEESRCENCEVTLRNSSNRLHAQVDGKAC